tara:strand:+ start:606 stop:1373 length:768 start_codon:yes stop_codon:yes gene_type:complete
MKKENKEFFDYTKSLPFIDITHFWDIPYKQILEEVKQVDEKYWSRPFNVDNNKVKELGLDDKSSLNYYPGSDGKLIEAHGWKTLCMLNETGESSDQIYNFPPVFNTANDYKRGLKDFKVERYWTNAAVFCPTLVNFFKEHISKYMQFIQISVTRLNGGGVITEHNDIPKDSRSLLDTEQTHMYNMLNTFNLCLNHVEGCYGVFDNKVIPAYEGCLRWTNIGKQHWVLNMNRQPQYQIIWNGIYKKSFRKLAMKNK